MSDIEELNALTNVCNKHGATLDALVKRMEAGNVPQTEIRRELEYATFVIGEFNSKLQHILES